MLAHIRYLAYVLRHKWHVFYAGVVLGVPLWQLLIHDASKFSPAEWGPYVRRFYGGRGSALDKTADPAEFHMAWRHHWTRNPHHWEYWLPEPVCEPSQGPLPMPERYCREMVADWYGAGMAQSKPDVAAWYAQHGDKKRLHADTRALVERLIRDAQARKLIP